LPAWGVTLYPTYDSCHQYTLLYEYYRKGSVVPINAVDEYINYNKSGIKDPLIPIEAIGNIAGYTASEAICVDCRLRGTRIQPAYWRYQ
jgi:hypothetical protein